MKDPGWAVGVTVKQNILVFIGSSENGHLLCVKPDEALLLAKALTDSAEHAKKEQPHD